MPRILVADDNANIQKMVALALEERGIDVVSVGNGEAAVRRIPDLSPDLVLADVFMPVRNGYEVCEFVKTNERFSHVPVILLVGAFDPLDEKEARRVGADGVLKKPFVPPDPLIAMVTSALEKNPHVAAEMEKARETPAAPPEPELPAIALEPPARMTPKPLPDFPEPSPEEAALIYGFEKKKIEKSDEGDDTESRPRFSHRKPESEDDFDGAATAHDWRRSAADFEIPDDLNKKAIAPDDDLTVVFPSERNKAPKRISVPPIEPPAEPKVSAPPLSSVPGFTAVEEATPSHPIGFTAVPTDSATTSRFSAHEESRPSAKLGQASPSAETEPNHSADADGLPSPSEYAEDGWMSALLGKFRRGKAPQSEPVNSESAQAVESATDSVPAASEPIADPPKPVPASWEAPLQPAVEAIVPALALHAASQESAPSPSGSNEPVREDSESGFFAKESHEVPDAPPAESWFAPNPTTLDDSELSHGTVSAFSADTAGNLLASPADVNDDERSQFSPASDAGSACETAPQTRAVPPHVPSSTYGPSSSSLRETTDDEPEHPPFFETADGNSGARDDATNISEPPHAAGSGNASDDAAKQERLSSIFAPPLPEAASEPPISPASVTPTNGSTERIPTIPPPSREAIADIPFLMPPPPAPFEPPTPSNSESPKTAEPTEPPSVDAVVSRLLEKLQPQIHDMLAKDLLKPLVENLLQQELTNKSK
ncbi:MAG TPA: response regulator [Candidatus Acidoferrum sp.]|nr:response regulator [Candidatus Acidoferrum sp.]